MEEILLGKGGSGEGAGKSESQGVCRGRKGIGFEILVESKF
jgi:hypothetical protein